MKGVGPGIVAELRQSARLYREYPVWNRDGEPVHLTHQAEECDKAADILLATLKALNACVSVLTDPVIGTYDHDDPAWYAAVEKAVDQARQALSLASGDALSNDGGGSHE